jgi:hypothetical protein
MFRLTHHARLLLCLTACGASFACDDSADPADPSAADAAAPEPASAGSMARTRRPNQAGAGGADAAVFTSNQPATAPQTGHSHGSETAADGGVPDEKPGEPAAGGETRNFKVALTTADEVPLCAAAAKWATGIGSATIAADESSITVTLAHYNLSGAPMMAHIHPGKAGDTGPAVLELDKPLASPIRQTFTAADYAGGPDAPPDFAAFVQSMKAGESYFNVHTEACPMGEIRGQIADPAPPVAEDKPMQPPQDAVFATELSAAAEIPLCEAGGPDAQGLAAAVISADRSQLAIDFQHLGLSGAPMQAHVHAGAADEAGPVVLDFGEQLMAPFFKVFTASDYRPPADGPADFAGFLDALEAGNAYLNVHTAACPSGEIRGQLSIPVLHARLSPADELESCPGAGELAVGAGTVIVTENGEKIELELAYAGLSAAPLMVHIHAGTPEDNGPAVLTLSGSLDSPIRTELTAQDYNALPNAPPDFAAFVASLRAGNAYFNVHTAACAAGEIRGQIR